MNISAFSGSLESLFNFANLSSRSATTETSQDSLLNEEIITQSADATYAGIVGAVPDPSDLMARNYADARPERSKYINAQLQAYTIDNKIRDRLKSLVEYLSTNTDSKNQYTRAAILRAKIQRQMQQIQNAAVLESSRDDLEESREGYAEKAEESLAPEGHSQEPTPAADGAAVPASITGLGKTAVSQAGTGAYVDTTV